MVEHFWARITIFAKNHHVLCQKQNHGLLSVYQTMVQDHHPRTMVLQPRPWLQILQAKPCSAAATHTPWYRPRWTMVNKTQENHGVARSPHHGPIYNYHGARHTHHGSIIQPWCLHPHSIPWLCWTHHGGITTDHGK